MIASAARSMSYCDPVEGRRPGLGVELEPGGAGVAVARLADAARVDQPAALGAISSAGPGGRLGAAGVVDGLGAAGRASASAKNSATWEWPTKLTRRAWARMHSAAWSGQSTYSQIGSRGEAW